MTTELSKSIPLRDVLIGYAKRFVLYMAVVLVIIAIVDLVVGWRTIFLYAESLFLAGALVMTIGALSTMGHWAQTRNFQYQYARSVSDSNLLERAQADKKDAEASYSFSTLAISIGFGLVALSILIHQII